MYNIIIIIFFAFSLSQQIFAADILREGTTVPSQEIKGNEFNSDTDGKSGEGLPGEVSGTHSGEEEGPSTTGEDWGEGLFGYAGTHFNNVEEGDTPLFPQKDFTFFLFSVALLIVSFFLLYEGVKIQKVITTGKKHKFNLEKEILVPIIASFSILGIGVFYLFSYQTLCELALNAKNSEYRFEREKFLFFYYLSKPRLLASAFLIASLIPAMVGLLKFLMITVSPFKQGTKAKTEIGFAQRLTWSALLGAIITAITLATSVNGLYKELALKKEPTSIKESTLKQGEGMGLFKP